MNSRCRAIPGARLVMAAAIMWAAAGAAMLGGDGTGTAVRRKGLDNS